ncbi:DUF7700 domain-containing protein [Aldersonia kunmingensis]|uniref:DUF7700 domain-containing protein n=1 Tax=Aldersonia kunmingensis TaxID=408066 RepID=UPI00082D3A7A|nr:hypothetical protein [Aldersonia kunmingensis]
MTDYRPTRLGRLYDGDPLPVVIDATTYYPAGAITFGVEGRALYAHGEDAPWAGGPTLHVFDAESGREHLRFDAFPGDEHYHYLTPGVQNHWIGFDTAANGEFTAWIVDRLRTRLPELLRAAGATDLAARVDVADVDDILEPVVAHLRSRSLQLPAPQRAVAGS